VQPNPEEPPGVDIPCLTLTLIGTFRGRCIGALCSEVSRAEGRGQSEAAEEAGEEGHLKGF